MAKKKKPKGRIVAHDAVNRKKGEMYFVDGDGNVRATKMRRTGAKRGHKTCR